MGKIQKRMKKTSLSYQQKKHILELMKSGVSKDEIVKQHKICVETLRRILKDEAEITKRGFSLQWKAKKSNKATKFPLLERALATWFYQRRAFGEPISGPILQLKALEFSQKLKLNEQLAASNHPPFTASSGWLDKFKKRHGIRKLTSRGDTISEDTSCVNEFKTDLAEKIDKEEIALENLYGADESGIYYRAVPQIASDLETAREGKENEERITSLFCSNAAGSHRLPLLCIGKSKSAQDLKNVGNLPVSYVSQSKAWMNRKIFLEWYEKDFIPKVLEHQRMTGVYGKVLLLLDNAPSHPNVDVLNAINRNFEVMYLPLNTTALLQPHDQGLISLTKTLYKRALLEKLYAEQNNDIKAFDLVNGKTLRPCFQMLSWAWSSVKPRTLKKVWKPLLGDRIHSNVTAILPDLPSNSSDSSTCSNNDEDSAVENFVNVADQSEELRSRYKQEIIEWLNKNDGDAGWEPLTEDGIIAALTGENSETCEETSEDYSEFTESADNDEAVTTANNNEAITAVVNDKAITAEEALECFEKIIKYVEAQHGYSQEDLLATKKLRDFVQYQVVSPKVEETFDEFIT